MNGRGKKDPLAVRLFAGLARLLLPRDFRAEHLDSLTSVFSDLCRPSVARGRPTRTMVLLAREVPNLIRLALVEWTARAGHRRGWPRTTARPTGLFAAILVESLISDLRHALRRLLRTPAFTAVVVGTLAVGIGANTAVFSLVRGVVMEPLPFAGGDRLVELWRAGEDLDAVMNLSPSEAMVEAWQQRSRSFDVLAAVSETNKTYTGDGPPQKLEVAEVSPGLISMLGVRAVAGRLFVPEDGLAGGDDHVALLAEGLWRRSFGADPGIVGSTVTLSGEPYEVVGVLPRAVDTWFETGFFGVGPKEIWVPLEATPAGAWSIEPYIVGRLASGVSPTAAQAELEGIQSGLVTEGLVESKWTPVVVPPAQALDRNLRTGLWVAFGAVLIVLLIACVNVGNVLLVRGTARAQEMTIRSALGAGRGRLTRQVLTESLLVSFMGAGAGIVLAGWALRAVLAVAGESLPPLRAARVDGMVLGLTLVVTVLTGAVFGMVSARGLRARGMGVLPSRSGRGGSAGPRSVRGREILVGLQVSFALVLLLGAGLLLNSFRRLSTVDPGFDPRGLVSFAIELPEEPYPDDEARTTYVGGVVDAVSTLPRVTSVTWALAVPPVLPALFGRVEVEGREDDSTGPAVHVGNWVDPGYFATLGSRITEGRDFGPADGTEGRVVIVNEAMARRLWPSGGAVGQRIRLRSPSWVGGAREWQTVVGVTQDVKSFWLGDDPNRFQMYLPTRDRVRAYGTLIARVRGDPATSIPTLRSRVWAIDPSIPLDEVQVVQEKLLGTIARPRFQAALLSSFSLIGLFLALLGVYGVISLAVSQRTREIGVRVALGARTHEVIRLVLGGSLRAVVGGMAVGLAASLALSRFLESLLFGVDPVDPATYLVVVTLLVVVALGACVLPARRAVLIDPVEALRGE